MHYTIRIIYFKYFIVIIYYNNLYKGLLYYFFMLIDEQVRQEITSAREGSDIHGLVGKIAFFLHLKSNSADADTNWFSAQDILLKWSDSPYRKGLRADSSFGKQIHEMLNDRAYQNYRRRFFFCDGMNAYEDWMTAQYELGKQVLWQQSKIHVGMYP